MQQSKNALERLSMLAQIDLGAAATIITGESLWSKQREIARAVSKPRSKTVVPSTNASGKQLRATEPVLTEHGWREVRTLQVGDRIYSQDGTLTAVTGVYPQGRQRMYRFHLDNKITVDSGGPHLWAVDAYAHTPGDGPRYTKQRKVMSTDEIVERYGGLGHKPNPQRRVSLPMVMPIQFPSKNTPLDPYTLGLLLGDGCLTQSTPVLTTADPEVLAYLPYPISKRSAKYEYGVLGIFDVVRDLGISGHLAQDKFVPELYLWNDVETRLAVLQGLMDADGGISGAGTEFNTTSQKLADNVRFLVQSLGGRCSITERTTSYNYMGSKKQGRLAYRMHITIPTCPFRIARKVTEWHRFDTMRRKTKAYTIQWVEEVAADEAVCISVDHPSSLYVIGNFIVTHNTWLAARIAAAFYRAYTPGVPCVACGGPCRGSKVLTTSSKEEHLKLNLWGEIATVRAKAAARGTPLDGRYLEGDLRIEESSSNHYITGQTANSPEALQGMHAAHKLIIGDEATAVSDDVKLAITRLLATADSRLLLIYNPTTPDTYPSILARSERVEVIRITAFDTPHFTGEPVPDGANLITPEFLEDLKAQGMGPGTFEWQTSIEARDWDLGEDVLITPPWYDECSTQQPPVLGHATVQIGVDIASYGSDECTIAVREGDQLVEMQAFPSMRPDILFQTHVTRLAEKWRPNVLVFDGDGVGAGAIGEAENLAKHMAPGGKVIPFRGGVGAGKKFANARSAQWWRLRQAFETGAITVHVDDPTLRTQMTNLRYRVNTKGKLQIETKAEMKKRGIGSPDRGDAVMYAFAFADDITFSSKKRGVAEQLGVSDRSEAAMWRRDLSGYSKRKKLKEINPVFGISDDY